MLIANRIEVNEVNGDEICVSADDAKHHRKTAEMIVNYG